MNEFVVAFVTEFFQGIAPLTRRKTACAGAHKPEILYPFLADRDALRCYRVAFAMVLLGVSSEGKMALPFFAQRRTESYPCLLVIEGGQVG